MKIITDVYLDKKLRKKRDRIITDLRAKEKLSGIYLLTLSDSANWQLDIFSANQLYGPFYHRPDFLIVGMAKGYDDALELVRKITDDIYRANGGTAYKEYFNKMRIEEI